MAVELASGYVSLVPSTRGFGAALDKQIGPEVDKAARDAGTRAGDGFTSSFGSGLGKLAAIAATAFAGLQVGNFFKDTILAASDLNETVNKVSVVFGDSAGVVQAWGQTAATALGQSTQQALEAAGTFGNLFRAMGLTSDVSADMSTKFVGLAADLASFNNANPADVLIALKSGLVGETEPLRQFGVNLNDIRIKAEAARLGLVHASVDSNKFSAAQEAADKSARKATEALKKYGAGAQQTIDANLDAAQASQKLGDVLGGEMPTQLDAATKAQAAYSLIMQDTSLAQGDFGRTSDGLANQLRILQAQFKDSSAKIGQAFLPITLKIVKTLTSKVLPALQAFGVGAATNLGHAFDAIAASPSLKRFGEKIVDVLAFVYFRIFDFVKTVAPLVKAFGGLFVDVAKRIGGTSGDGFLPAVRTMTATVEAIVERFVANTLGFLEQFRAGFDGAGDSAEGFAGQLGQDLGKLIDSLKGFVDGFKNGAKGIEDSGLEGKLANLGDKLGALVKLVDDHKDVFGPITVAVAGLASALVVTSKVSPVLGVLSGALGSLGTVVGILTSPLGIVVGLIAGLGTAAFIAYKKFTPFQAAVDSVAQTFKRAGLGAAVDEAGTQFGRLFEIVKPKLIEFRDKAVQWLKDHGPEIFRALGAALVGALGFLKDEVLVPLGNWITETGLPFLKGKFGEWSDSAVGWIEGTALPKLKEKLPAVIDAIIGFLQENEPKVLAGFNTLADKLFDWVETTAIPKLQEKLPGILAALTDWANQHLPEWGDQLGLLAVDALGRITTSIIEHLPELANQIPAQLAILGLALIGGIVAGAIGPEGVAALQAIPNGILALFTDLPGKISAAAVGMWDGIYDAFKGALNLIIRAWNGLEFTVGQFHVPGTDKDFGGITIGTPDIPELAGGGVFNSPFTGMLRLAETPSARPEIVTPQKLLAQTFRKELATVGAGGGGGVQFGDIVVNGAQASPASIADAVFAKAGWLHFTGRREL